MCGPRTSTHSNGNIIYFIMDRAKESIPVSRVRENKRPSCPWWNHACELSVRARKKCLTKLKRNPTPTNLEHYRVAQREVIHTVLQAKTDCWDQFCESMIVKANNGKFVSSKPFWDKIRQINGNQFKAVPLLKVGNIAAADSLGKANLLAKHYAAVTQDSNIAVETLEHQKEFESSNSNFLDDPGPEDIALNLPFSLVEMRKCLASRTGSAPGKDQISYLLIKNLPDVCMGLVLRLINQVWARGVLPDAWKEAIVVPIHKAGKAP